MNAAEITELEELAVAVEDTQESAHAVIGLREELAALGCQVDVAPELWRAAVAAQRSVETAYLEIFEAIKDEALRSLHPRKIRASPLRSTAFSKFTGS
jgi:hypothetical protein